VSETNAVLKALHAVWLELEYVQKDATGQGYSYVSDLSLTSTVHPALAKQGLMLVPSGCDVTFTQVQDTKGGAHQYRCDARAGYNLYHTSGERIAVAVAGSAIGTDKMTTSALTACHKLACRQLLMLATGEDNEKPPTSEQREVLYEKALSLKNTPKFRPFCQTNWAKFTKDQQGNLAHMLREEKKNGAS